MEYKSSKSKEEYEIYFVSEIAFYSIFFKKLKEKLKNSKGVS